MKGVQIEPDPTVHDPTARCIDPQRIRNTNAYPVIATYELHYWGEGPSPLCDADWKTQETIRLEREGLAAAYRYLGCSQTFLAGSLCVERRQWQILAVSRAQAGVFDSGT